MKNPGLDRKVISERLKTLREREGTVSPGSLHNTADLFPL